MGPIYLKNVRFLSRSFASDKEEDAPDGLELPLSSGMKDGYSELAIVCSYLEAYRSALRFLDGSSTSSAKTLLTVVILPR